MFPNPPPSPNDYYFHCTHRGHINADLDEENLYRNTTLFGVDKDFNDTKLLKNTILFILLIFFIMAMGSFSLPPLVRMTPLCLVSLMSDVFEPHNKQTQGRDSLERLQAQNGEEW